MIDAKIIMAKYAAKHAATRLRVPRQVTGNWKTPATYQMLYAHGYPDDSDPLNAVIVTPNTDGHDSFYGYLERIGDYNPYVPKVAIAYSNFYAPHDDMQATTTEQVYAGDIDLPFVFPCARLDSTRLIMRAGFETLANAWLTAGYHEALAWKRY